jgi:outer membrane protein TolC
VTLEQAYALAIKSSPTVRLLAQRTRAARHRYEESFIPLKPTLGLRASYTHNDELLRLDPNEFIPSGLGLVSSAEPIRIQERNQFAVYIKATVPLLRPGTYPQISAARNQARVAQLREIRSKEDFLLEVGRGYYRLLAWKEGITALERKVARDRQSVKQAKARVQSGTTPRTDQLRAELELTQSFGQLDQERIRLSAGRASLAILLGLTEAIDVVRPPLTTTWMSVSSLEALCDRAGNDRQDLHAAALELEAARMLKKAVRLSFLPSAEAAGLFRWDSVKGFSERKVHGQFMLNLTMPLYDGGQRYSLLRMSEINIARRKAEQDQLKRQVHHELIRQRAMLRSALSNVVVTRQAIELARSAAKDTERHYQVGAATQLELLDANQRLLQAELAAAQLGFQIAAARLGLEHATGVLRHRAANR